MQRRQHLLEVGQFAFAEAGTDPPGELQPTWTGDAHEQRPDATAAPAFPGAPATNDDFLGVPVLVLTHDAQRRPG